MKDLLIDNPLLLLFLVAAIGYAVGRIRIGGFNLGVAAVLFTGLAIGAIDPRLKLPEFVHQFGLVLFVYTVGLASGPGFARSLKGRGMRDNLFALGILLFGAGLVAVIQRVFDFSPALGAGLFTGSFTNTAALASVLETVHGEEPVFGYSVAYPFGVVGLLIAFHLAARLWKVDFRKEAQAIRDPSLAQGKLLKLTILVTQPAATEKTVLEHRRDRRWRVIFGRHLQAGQTRIVGVNTRVGLGDRLTIIGDETDVNDAMAFFGEVSQEEIDLDHKVLDFRRIFVSNPKVAEHTLAELQIPQRFGGIVSRVRRGDVEILPDGRTELELGDRVRVVAPRERIAEISTYLGDSYKAVSEIDVIPLGAGIALGLLLGMLPIPLPGTDARFHFGLAGGVLIAGLTLGWLGRTGPVIWNMPYSANQTLRQMGLVLFLAGIGTRSGWTFVTTLGAGQGLLLLACGALITTLAVVVALWVGYKLLRIPLGVLIGMVAGIHTQAAALAFANEQTGLDLPNTGYAEVYPISTVAKIILAQVLLLLP